MSRLSRVLLVAIVALAAAAPSASAVPDTRLRTRSGRCGTRSLRRRPRRTRSRQASVSLAWIWPGRRAVLGRGPRHHVHGQAGHEDLRRRVVLGVQHARSATVLRPQRSRAAGLRDRRERGRHVGEGHARREARAAERRHLGGSSAWTSRPTTSSGAPGGTGPTPAGLPYLSVANGRRRAPAPTDARDARDHDRYRRRVSTGRGVRHPQHHHDHRQARPPLRTAHDQRLATGG